MIEKLKDLQFVEDRSAQDQIQEHVRTVLVSGELQPGRRFPSTQDLADLWNAHTRTVQLALQPLAREGLLKRIPRVGTFVAKPAKKLTTVGIYYREDFLSSGTSMFMQSLHAQLKEHLNARDIETDVWIDPRPEAERRAGAWQPFAEAAQRRQFQAFIAPASDHDLLRWLTRLPVPGAYLTNANVPGRVDHDLPQLVEAGVQALAAQGCRSVGFITSTTYNPVRDDAPHVNDLMFERFLDVAGRLGLQLRNDWVLSSAIQLNGGAAHEAFGYEAFHRWWDLPNRPDGLLVFPDSTVRGVILAMAERGVRVPDDLKVAFHKNEELDLLCPFPAAFLVSSEREAARALITQLEKQFRGEPSEPIWIGYRVAERA